MTEVKFSGVLETFSVIIPLERVFNTNDTRPHMTRIRRFSITIPEEVFLKVEKARGDVARSKFIARILERALKEEK